MTRFPFVTSLPSKIQNPESTIRYPGYLRGQFSLAATMNLVWTVFYYEIYIQIHIFHQNQHMPWSKRGSFRFVNSGQITEPLWKKKLNRICRLWKAPGD